MYRTSILLLAIAACGGTVEPQANDVPSTVPTAVEQLPSPAACVPLEQHCTVGGKDDTYGNIWRYRADCTVEYGGCLGATPTCSNGACVAPPTDCPLAGHVVTCVDAHNALLCMGGGRTPDLGVLTPMPCVGTMQCVWPNGNEGTCTGQ